MTDLSIMWICLTVIFLALIAAVCYLPRGKKPNLWLAPANKQSGVDMAAFTTDESVAKKWSESYFVYPCIKIREGI